ncbi:MAG: AEC family transporter [Erysipelotrichaceae bacterium]
MFFDKLLNVELQIILFFMIGIFLKKKNVANSNSDTFLSSFILNIIMPTNIFLCFYNNVSANIMLSSIPLIFVGVLVVIAIQLFSKINPFKLDSNRRKISEYGMLISNGSLVGLPIVENLFGSIGVVYANIFMIPTRILAFSFAEKYFNPNYQKLSLKNTIINFLSNPITIAMIVGFSFNVLHIVLPTSLNITFSSLSSCMSPLALILVGSTLADIEDFKIFLQKDLWAMSLFRLFISPLITAIITVLLNLPITVTMVAVIINATPVASTATIFCKKYNGDLSYTSGFVFLTTALSIISLFLVCTFIQRIFII